MIRRIRHEHGSVWCWFWGHEFGYEPRTDTDMCLRCGMPPGWPEPPALHLRWMLRMWLWKLQMLVRRILR